MSKSNLVTLALTAVTFSHKFQPRQELNKEAVKSYTELAKEAFEKGADWPLPPLKAIKRGEEYIAIAGFHRRPAAKAAGYEELPFEIIEGDNLADNEIFALAIRDNAEHGVRYTDADKLHNVLRIFEIPGNEALSNVQIADLALVSESFVRKHRPAAKASAVRVTKGGKTQDTSRIGKKGGKAEKPSKAKAKGAAPAAGDKPDEPKEDAEYERSLCKLGNILKDEYPTAVDAITKGDLPLTAKEVKDWAQSSESRIVRIAPLVIEKRFSPKKAYALIDQELESKDRIEQLELQCIGNRGLVKVKIGAFEHTVRFIGDDQNGGEAPTE